MSLLIGSSGFFRWRFGSLLWAVAIERRQALLEQLEGELESQLDRLEADGFRPDHINSERHVHQIPGLFEKVVAAAERRGIRWVRLGREIGGRFMRPRHLVPLLQRGGPLKQAILSMLTRRNRKRLGSRSTTAWFASYLYSGRLDWILDRVVRAPQGGLTEIMVHPGIPEHSCDVTLGNPPLERYLRSRERRDELEACIAAARLLAPDQLTTFARAGVDRSG